jgi:cytochrome c
VDRSHKMSTIGAFRTAAWRDAPATARPRLIAATLVVAIATSLNFAGARADDMSPLERDGLALAERMCAQCHAVGALGTSPHSAAPAFRDISRRVDLDQFSERLREGLLSGHPDMPTFRFSREDARALIAYLRSIQGP